MPGFWRKCRIAFRCVRITTWLLVLAMLGLFLWVNRVGLPDFLKTRLVAALHEHGVNLEFSRMRLSLVRGIVAEDVRIGGTGTNYNPSFTASQVQLDLDFPALRHRRLELDGLDLRNGFFSLPLSPTNGLALTNLNTLLRFGTNDTWSLEHFRATLAGVQILISGEVTHAREAAEWKLFAGGETNRGVAYEPLKNFADALGRIHFEGEPQLKLNLSGDARNLHSIAVRLNVSAGGVQTPDLSAQNIQAEASLTAPADAPTNNAAYPAFCTGLLPFKLTWSAHLDALRLPRLNVSDATFAGAWAAPQLAVSRISGKLGDGRLTASALLDVPSRKLAFTNDSSFDPHILAGLLPDAANLQLAKIRWSHSPVLQAEGSLRLPPWNQSANINASPDDLLSTLELRGALAFTNGVVLGRTLDRFQTRFSYEDWIVGVTDLTVVQGRTQLHLSGQESEATKNFHVRVNGDLDAASVRSLLTQSNVLHGLSLLNFQQPLALTVEASGNLRRLETLTATGQLALADFAIRSQTVDRVSADFTYTNLMVDFLRPQLSRAVGKETFVADKLTLDIAGERLFIFGGSGSVEPMVVGRAIGPKTSADMAPYEFLTLPSARVNGCIPIKQKDGEVVTDDADVWFDLTDTVRFRWKKFETPAITGTIHWWKDYIILTNAVSECYGGEARGWGVFNVSPAINGTDFSFLVNGTNVDFHRMGLALWSPTNHLAGSLSGRVFITQANSEDWRTWNGGGRMQLRDGLLWDVPVIALMSPLLNAVSPGLGNSQATEATAAFVMTNGVIHTDSMLIRSTMMRLQYAGTVDLEQNVDARVTAQLLRNTPVVGPLVSTVLWPVSKIFECHVTGTLENPVVKPIYIPKILLLPLHPLRTIEDLFSPSRTTNAPAAN